MARLMARGYLIFIWIYLCRSDIFERAKRLKEEFLDYAEGSLGTTDYWQVCYLL